jgi:hypothetical protein
MINTVYRIKKGRLEILRGKDTLSEIDAVQKSADPSLYKFYDHGMQNLLIRSASAITPLLFPRPDDYGLSSAELYAKAVTYPWVMAQAERKGLKKPPSFLSQLRDTGYYVAIIVILAALAFIMAILIRG